MSNKEHLEIKLQIITDKVKEQEQFLKEEYVLSNIDIDYNIGGRLLLVRNAGEYVFAIIEEGEDNFKVVLEMPIKDRMTFLESTAFIDMQNALAKHNRQLNDDLDKLIIRLDKGTSK